MQNPSEEAKLQNYGDFLADVEGDTVPAVSFVRPFESLAGHPADSTADLYEMFLQDLIAKVQANPDLWASTAIIITTDEGGGYYDSGYAHSAHRRVALCQAGLRRSHVQRSRVTAEIHREELGPADDLVA
jgi:phospholipase C